MKEEIKRSIGICENCDKFECLQYVRKKKIHKKEYTCVVDGGYLSQMFDSIASVAYLSFERYIEYPLPDSCPYKLEHTVMSRKLLRCASVCANCENNSEWTFLGDRLCLLSGYDYNFFREQIKWDRGEFDYLSVLEEFNVASEDVESKETLKNVVPHRCPYMLEHIVIGEAVPDE